MSLLKQSLTGQRRLETKTPSFAVLICLWALAVVPTGETGSYRSTADEGAAGQLILANLVTRLLILFRGNLGSNLWQFVADCFFGVAQIEAVADDHWMVPGLAI